MSLPLDVVHQLGNSLFRSKINQPKNEIMKDGVHSCTMRLSFQINEVFYSLIPMKSHSIKNNDYEQVSWNSRSSKESFHCSSLKWIASHRGGASGYFEGLRILVWCLMAYTLSVFQLWQSDSLVNMTIWMFIKISLSITNKLSSLRKGLHYLLMCGGVTLRHLVCYWGSKNNIIFFLPLVNRLDYWDKCFYTNWLSNSYTFRLVW